MLAEVGLHPPGFHPRQGFEDRLQRAVLLDQRHRGLLADPGDAGDVVGGIALQRLVIGDQRGLEPEALADLLQVVDDGVGDAAPVDEHPDMRGHQLQGVDVAGDDDDIEPRLRGLHRQRADHVVGLEAGQLDVGDAQGGDDLARPSDLGPQLGGHRRPLRLVGRHLLMAEGGPRRVEGGDGVGRLLLGEGLEQHRGEAVGGIGQLAATVAQRRHGEEGAIDQGVAVDQQQGGARRGVVVAEHRP